MHRRNPDPGPHHATWNPRSLVGTRDHSFLRKMKEKLMRGRSDGLSLFFENEFDMMGGGCCRLPTTDNKEMTK